MFCIGVAFVGRRGLRVALSTYSITFVGACLAHACKEGTGGAVAAADSAFHGGHVILPGVVARQGKVRDRRALGGAQGIAAGGFTVD